MELTYNELQWRLESLGKRLKSQRAFNAKLHNFEIVGNSSKELASAKLTDEQKEKLNKAMERGISRRKLVRKSDGKR